ncbi:MAG: hypothetical protein K2P14_10325 [Anaeroplasmataceae bacterium]|nr:hypothetical protein [Anaeroplasmataceae bacterium]
MSKLPKEIKLTFHAQQRLEERKNPNYKYNTKNLMKSSCKWYNKDDLIPQSQFYLHCLYVCRKSNQLGCITDGDIEVIYNKGTGVALTVLEVKDKFKPITQYIKPQILKQIEKKKEIKKMKKTKTENEICPDCGKEGVRLTSQGICLQCRTRKTNAIFSKKPYIPYLELSKKDQKRIDAMRKAQEKKKIQKSITMKEEKEETLLTHVTERQKIMQNTFDPLSDQMSFVATLRECGCEISDENLKEVLDVLISTDKLKDIFLTIAQGENQDAMLNLEHALNVVERKLQHNWEYNGFQEADDIKFKGFLTWRRVLKGSIFFWKKLYQSNILVEMQKAWNAYASDPNEKILLTGDRINSTLKRFQITTESISTIFNTRRPFTRVFYALSQEDAYEKFVKWMAERQLHENKQKTTIIELTTEGEDGRKKEDTTS